MVVVPKVSRLSVVGGAGRDAWGLDEDDVGDRLSTEAVGVSVWVFQAAG